MWQKNEKELFFLIIKYEKIIVFSFKEIRIVFEARNFRSILARENTNRNRCRTKYAYWLFPSLWQKNTEYAPENDIKILFYYFPI